MSIRRAAVMAAAAIAAAACSTARSASDADSSNGALASGQDSAAAIPAEPAMSSEKPAAPLATSGGSASAGSGQPNGVAKPAVPAAAPGAITKRPGIEPGATGAAGPVRTSPAPGVNRPSGATPALVVFRDSVLQSDLDWLKGEGFTIANVDDASHTVSVAVPDGYSGNPTKNPRIRRFTIAMR